MSGRPRERRLSFAVVRQDPAAARALLDEVVERAGGVIVHAAAELGMCRRHLQRIVWQLDAWPMVEDARDRRAGARFLSRA